MSIVELDAPIGVAIPDTVEELLAIWDDGKEGVLVLYANVQHAGGWFRKGGVKEEVVQRTPARLPNSPGTKATYRGTWHADCTVRGFVMRVEQPGGPWDGVSALLLPTTSVFPGDRVQWEFNLVYQ